MEYYIPRTQKGAQQVTYIPRATLNILIMQYYVELCFDSVLILLCSLNNINCAAGHGRAQQSRAVMGE